MCGHIEVIVGPMSAGKTEELLRRIRRLKYSKLTYVVFKHSLDKRYGSDAVISHNKDSEPCINVSTGEEMLSVVKNRYQNVNVVAVDEVQFFDKTIVDTVTDLVNNGKRIILSGLDMDYLAKPFGYVGDLLAMADHVSKLKAVCSVCGDDAGFSKRIIKNDNTVVVGGTDVYTAVCRKHLF